MYINIVDPQAKPTRTTKSFQQKGTQQRGEISISNKSGPIARQPRNLSKHTRRRQSSRNGPDCVPVHQMHNRTCDKEGAQPSSWASPCACQPRSTKCSTCPARVLKAQMTYDLNCHRHSAAMEELSLEWLMESELEVIQSKEQMVCSIGTFPVWVPTCRLRLEYPSTSEGGRHHSNISQFTDLASPYG
ncbi:hypothetical protein CEXT_57731 [Caerostris extrusa]|uniref:Uncharacterized protein n=1 Tax=Caerostris extrusa TaxID=172846 RepID=A0AAV4XKD4_CAEEX|nr:hypothetical protein CEXT_57731 [Caerostris extrusa]